MQHLRSYGPGRGLHNFWQGTIKLQWYEAGGKLAAQADAIVKQAEIPWGWLMNDPQQFKLWESQHVDMVLRL